MLFFPKALSSINPGLELVSKSSLSVCMSDVRINKAFHNRGGAYEYHGIA